MSASGTGWVDTSRSGPPASEVTINTDIALALLATWPDPAPDAPLGDRFDGWDMAVFRVGAHHALRLPRTLPAVTSLATEANALAHLGKDWAFPHPRIVHLGEPTPQFPWPWALTTWIDGDTADFAPLDAAAGTDLGAALAELHAPAPADAPFNLEQSIALAQRSEGLEWALEIVRQRKGPAGQRLDVGAALTVWATALAAAGPGQPVWSHADCHGSNVLGKAGAFAGLIDWGKMAACDRAVDLAFLYASMPAEGVDLALATYREATGLTDPDTQDPGLEARVRGIALTKAAAWATLDREANVVMAWRMFEGLGILVP